MTHALVMHAGPAHAHTFRALVTAAFCAGALALLCAAAVLNGPAAPSTAAAGRRRHPGPRAHVRRPLGGPA